MLMQAVSGNLYALLDDVLHANILLPAGPVGSTCACAFSSDVVCFEYTQSCPAHCKSCLICFAETYQSLFFQLSAKLIPSLGNCSTEIYEQTAGNHVLKDHALSYIAVREMQSVR